MNLTRDLIHGLVSLVYPRHCASCGSATESGTLCEVCAESAVRLERPFCWVCSQPFDGAIEGDFLCANCQDRNWHVRCIVAPWRSRGPVRQCMHRFKYGGATFLRGQLVDWMEQGMADPRLEEFSADCLVPVPLHPRRFRERGYNQSRLLAEELGNRRGLRVDDLLKRIRYTSTQKALDREERMENLAGAFRLRNGHDVTGKRLLLIDDVLTTGSTLDACAGVLLEAGAAQVAALTVARG